MPGISLHTELEALERVGLEPRDVLRAATIHPAQVLGLHDRGQVLPGKRADLLLLSEDPRQSAAALDRIVAVFQAGRLVDRNALLARERGVDGEIVAQRQLRLPVTRLETVDGSGQLRPGAEHLARIDLSEIAYRSDGLEVKAMLAAPRDEGPYPALVYCRGGNRSFGEITDERAWGFLATVASWGYLVVAPQYRGNRGGQGTEEFGGADVNDVLNALPLLRQHQRVDPDRIGLYGGSRGAMMGLCALRRSNAFRAAVFRCGLTDLVQWKVQRPEIETVYSDLIPGYVSGDDAPLIERSPIYWVDELPKTTPILWMHGTADWRVAPESGLRFAAELQAQGHPYRLVMFEGADHSLTGFTDQRDEQTRLWLDRYVRDRAPAPEMKPHGN